MKYQDTRPQKLEKFTLPTGFRGRNGVTLLIWQFVQATFFAVSPQPFYAWRRLLLRLFGAKIGADVQIRQNVKVTFPWKVTIGDRSWIGDNATLYSLGDIVIGSDVVVSQKCYICTGSHDYRDDSFAIYAKPITIKDGAWLATDVFVAPGVVIGQGAVVSARASVWSDLPPMMICSGTPAGPIKSRLRQTD